MQAAVVVVTIRIVLLSMLLVVFPGVIDNVCNDGGNIVVVGAGGGITCGSADVMITIYVDHVQQRGGEDRTLTRQGFRQGWRRGYPYLSAFRPP